MKISDKQRILFAEDVSTDREIAERIIRENGIQFVSECVDTEKDFRLALQKFKPTLIISDYLMPAFNGREALEIAMKEKPDVPFVILTGSTNEDIAVECIKAGADDYVIKQNLKRLVPAIKSAIDKKSSLKAEKKSYARLKESEAKYRTLIENSPDAICLFFNNKFELINPTFEKMYGYSIEELNAPGFDLNKLVVPESRSMLNKLKKELKSGEKVFSSLETITISKFGKLIHIEAYIIRFNYKEDIGIQCIIRDLTQRKQIEEKNIILSKAVDQSPESIVITNKNGDIEYVNPIFEERTGYSFDEVEGKNPRILQSGKHDHSFYENLWNTLLSGKNWYGEFLNKKKNGELYWEQASISPITGEDGEIEHFVAVKEDITEKKKILNDLKEAKEKAEESNRLKTAFLQNISHEIRTPMNGILGFSSLLEQPELDEDRKSRYIGMIQRSGDRMLHIINDLIDISRIETRQINIQKRRVNLNKVLKNVYELQKEEIEEKGIHFSYVSSLSDEESYILTDETRLNQILTNLLNNAGKFTEKGKIILGYTRKDDNVEFFVKDTGVGISPDLGYAIFDRFVQEDMHRTRQYEGAGLGLCISKELCELLGGKIWYNSEPVKGSTFYFTIPL